MSTTQSEIFNAAEMKNITKNPKDSSLDLAQAPQNVPTNAFYHLRTLWLTIYTDLKCIGIPMTVFGILSANSGLALAENDNSSLISIITRAPVIFLWLCMLLVHFCTANQMQTEAVIEDRINKSWRPIPSGRISQTGMWYLFLAWIPLEIIMSIYFGTLIPCLAHMFLTYAYNDLKLAETGYFWRNFLIALGYTCYTTSTTIIAAGSRGNGLDEKFWQWSLIVAAQIFTTIQMQDLPDIIGDGAKGRRTMPLVLGDSVTRWSIALPVLFWSFVCPMFWKCNNISTAIIAAFGVYFAARVLLLRTIPADKTSWRMWCVWSTLLYCLPLVRSLTA